MKQWKFIQKWRSSRSKALILFINEDSKYSFVCMYGHVLYNWENLFFWNLGASMILESIARHSLPFLLRCNVLPMATRGAEAWHNVLICPNKELPNGVHFSSPYLEVTNIIFMISHLKLYFISICVCMHAWSWISLSCTNMFSCSFFFKTLSVQRFRTSWCLAFIIKMSRYCTINACMEVAQTGIWEGLGPMNCTRTTNGKIEPMKNWKLLAQTNH